MKPESAADCFERIADDDLRETALAVRGIILRALPDAEECVKWGYPFYMRHGNLCYISIRKGKVELGMYRGVYLSNSNGLLQGDGKLIKHIIMNPDEDLPAAGITEILLEASELNASGKLKLKR